MRKILCALVFMSFLSSIALAATYDGSSGRVVGTKAQHASSGVTVGAGDLLVADALNVVGLQTATGGITVPSGATLTMAAGSTLVSTGLVTMNGVTGSLGLDVTYGITSGTAVIAGNVSAGTITNAGVQTQLGAFNMGSAAADGGVFSIIKGATGSDPTISITQGATDVTIAETVGDINITAADDITITATGANIGLVGATAVTGALSTTGALTLYSRTEAELKALTPPAVASLYFDSTNSCVVVSTGGAGGFVKIDTGGTPTGW